MFPYLHKKIRVSNLKKGSAIRYDPAHFVLGNKSKFIPSLHKMRKKVEDNVCKGQLKVHMYFIKYFLNVLRT